MMGAAAVSDGDFYVALGVIGLAVAVAILVYMVVVYRRLRVAEERAVREERETALEEAEEHRPVFFRRYVPSRGTSDGRE